jgi:hypothetical protein
MTDKRHVVCFLHWNKLHVAIYIVVQSLRDGLLGLQHELGRTLPPSKWLPSLPSGHFWTMCSSLLSK